MEFKDRMRQRMQELGIKSVDIHREVGVSKTTVSFWLNGSNEASGKNLFALAKFLRCTPEWLQFGIGAPGSSLAENAENHSQFSVNTTSPWTETVKVAAQHLSAGHGAQEQGMACSDEFEGEEEIDTSRLHSLGIEPGCALIVKIKGDSMYPTLWDGDKTITNTRVPHLISGNIYAFYFDGELKVKRFTKRMDGNWVISSDNKDDPSLMDEVVSPHSTQQLHIIGHVKDLYSRKL